MEKEGKRKRPNRRWGLLAALALGAGLTWARRDRHRQLYPPRGEVWGLPSGATHVIEGGSPDAPPLLLIHGSDGVALDWPLSPLWEKLAPHARLIALDRPGHGYTPARPGEAVTVEKNVVRCLELLDALGLEQVTVVGHSYGAAVALALALRRPERVRALVLISPLALPARGLTRPLAYVPQVPLLETLLTRVLLLPLGRVVAHIEGGNAFYPAPVHAAWQQMMLAFSRRREQVHALAWENRTLGRELGALRALYPSLRCPVTVLGGVHDRLAPYPQQAQALSGQVPGAELLTFSNGGHQLHWTHPEEVARATLAALPRSEG